MTFRGSDGTLLVMPASSVYQSINFQDKVFDLVIDSDLVKLGGQTITLEGLQVQ
ncbi:conserved hypothetical protein [Desulfamplus magnetovallimortis]|uniref:Uncharacterized protein n=1 Tax=Desulfamplus magnetovallimortis TaxID=1246637 RepID=A0A1W1H4M9_9BACT|nr:conserved hypothetical protein [Desulfamplus magnetovallimortis]